MAKSRANGAGSIAAHGDGHRLRWTMPDGTRKSLVLRGVNIFGVANFLIGGVIGVAFVIFDFFIRDQVMKNRTLFTQSVATS